MQFSRVFIIVASVPLIALALPGGGAPGQAASAGAGETSAAGLAVWLAAAALGVPLARLLRIPAGVLIGPLLLARSRPPPACRRLRPRRSSRGRSRPSAWGWD